MRQILLLSLAFSAFFTQAQMEPAPADLAVVYFVRTSGMGGLINFTYVDGDKIIGKHGGTGYVRYECEAGEHLFWARSENKSFVKADLKAGNIYILEARPTMGLVKSGVKLVPMDAQSNFKRFKKLAVKKEPESLTANEMETLTLEMADVIARGLEKNEKLDEKGVEIEVLNDAHIIPFTILSKE